MTACHVNLDGHRNVNGHCLYCSEPMTTPEPLSPERLTGIRESRYRDRSLAAADVDIDDLLAEVGRLSTELAKYVGHEPTIAEEMQHLSACLDAVYDLADEAKKGAGRWENPLPVPEWVEAVEQAAGGDWPRDPKDNRRSIYIDGRHFGWISTGAVDTDGYDLLASIDAPDTVESRESILQRTGSLREIGRCV